MTRVMTSFGLRSRSASGARPELLRGRRGRRFSTRTSAPSTSRRKAVAVAVVLEVEDDGRLVAAEELPEERRAVGVGGVGEAHRRVVSPPPGRSTLITVAPKSAR